jgi:hypothetical protein
VYYETIKGQGQFILFSRKRKCSEKEQKREEEEEEDEDEEEEEEEAELGRLREVDLILFSWPYGWIRRQRRRGRAYGCWRWRRN